MSLSGPLAVISSYNTDLPSRRTGRLIVATDYTHPDAAVENCAWFRSKNLPFVMGTTGYDVAAAHAAIGPDLYAVLAPNMGKPIVLFQAMLEHAACAPHTRAHTHARARAHALSTAHTLSPRDHMCWHAAATYPGALAGYKLRIVESHQAGKADTSGTAKAVAGSLAKLNASDFGVHDIEMVREPAEQKSRMGVATPVNL